MLDVVVLKSFLKCVICDNGIDFERVIKVLLIKIFIKISI